MFLRPWLVISAIVAVLADEPNDKLAAVDKALNLLESLREEVAKEGEEEANTYNKFACFCKDTTTDKLAAIQEGNDKKDECEATADALATARDTADTDIARLQGEIKLLADDMKAATKTRHETEQVYAKN